MLVVLVLQCKVHITSLSLICSSSYEADPDGRAVLGVATTHLLGLGGLNPAGNLDVSSCENCVSYRNRHLQRANHSFREPFRVSVRDIECDQAHY